VGVEQGDEGAETDARISAPGWGDISGLALWGLAQEPALRNGL